MTSTPASSYRDLLEQAQTAADLAAALQLERERLRERDLNRPHGLRSCRSLADAVDRLLHRMWRLCLPADAALRETVRSKVSIVATGGYGRRELCPHSDIDVSFIVAEEEDADLDLLVRQMFHWLMEIFPKLGLRVGYGYRTVPDAATLDHQTLTSLLDARPVAGSHGLAERFIREMFRHLWPAEFVRVKIRERSEVQAKNGSTLYCIEPELRDGAGGLRDIQLAEWLAAAAFPTARGDVWNQLHRLGTVSRGEAEQIVDARDFMLKLRVWSHWREARKADRLVRQRQEELAEFLGFQDDEEASRVERLMEAYYANAENVARIAAFVVDRCLTERLALSPELLCSGAEIYPAYPWVEIHHPVLLTEICYRYQSLGLRPGYELSRLIAQNSQFCNQEMASAHSNRFVDLFRATGSRGPSDYRGFLQPYSHAYSANSVGVYDTLVLMSRLGILQCFVPEMKDAFRRVPFDQVHRHTVGYHSLEVVRSLEQIRETEDESLKTFRDAWSGVQFQEVLYLAALLHDIGKLAKPGKDHTTAGAEMVASICDRLNIYGGERDALLFLIENHLLMSDTAQLRDLNLNKTIEDFVSVIGSTQHLSMLLLLTYADMDATGVLTPMKVRFLQELYYRAESRLSGPRTAAGTEEDKARRYLNRLSRDLAGGSISSEELRSHTESMPVSYLLSTRPEQVVLHIRMLQSLEPRGVEVQFEQEPGLPLTTLHICTNDLPTPGLLSVIAGVLYAHDVGVHAAQVFTRPSDPPVAIDTLWIDYRDWVVPPVKRLEIESDLKDVLVTGNVEELLRKRGRSLRPTVPPERVRVREDLADRHTVIEIKAPEHPGLLFWLTRAMARLGWNIASARIATQAGISRDAFYVSNEAGERFQIPVEAIEDALRAALAE